MSKKTSAEGKKRMADAERESDARYTDSIEKIREGSYRFSSKARGQAQLVLDELIDPEGETVATLADVEGDAGALALAMPLDLITFETWLLGQIGDQEQLDLESPSHREAWFNFGAWIGEALRLRHGGHWLFAGDNPANWRMGFSKIMLEVVPHAFAEQLLRMEQGAGKQLLGEIEKLRLQHEEQKSRDDGKEIDRYTAQHYIRLHTMPLGQWMVVDFSVLEHVWNNAPVSELIEVVRKQGRKLGEQNQPVIEQICQALGQAKADQPIASQTGDHGLFEAVAQVVSLRRTTAPVAMDILEGLVMPTMHIGLPETFPPLDDDDIGKLRKGVELFALFVDIVPHRFEAWDDGFLGTISEDDLASPYGNKTKLDISRGDWVLVNPKRFREMLQTYDSTKLLQRYDEFVKYVRADDKAPRRRDDGRNLAEIVAKALADFRASVVASAKPGHSLVFRMLPPPQ